MSKSLDEAKARIGELIVLGFKGLDLSPETARTITDRGIGGIILFAHNYESPAQVAELIAEVQRVRADKTHPLFISVDQEGGKVQRFKKLFTRIPEAALIGKTNSPKLAFEIAEVIASELKAVGINVNFCPIADIQTNPKNPVIGTRSFGEEEDLVSKMVTAMVRGHLVHKVLPVVKHFPGHGDTHLDSHFALPRVETTLETLRAREMIPFQKAFRSKCPMVMSAHIMNANLDPKYPGTLSRFVLQNLLREELRFKGVIFSDDMEMKAITDHFGIEDAPALAIEAGCDQVIYRSEEAGVAAYEALQKALETGKLSAKRVIESTDRVRAMKREYFIPETHAKISELEMSIGTEKNFATVQKVDLGNQES